MWGTSGSYIRNMSVHCTCLSNNVYLPTLSHNSAMADHAVPHHCSPRNSGRGRFRLTQAQGEGLKIRSQGSRVWAHALLQTESSETSRILKKTIEMLNILLNQRIAKRAGRGWEEGGGPRAARYHMI